MILSYIFRNNWHNCFNFFIPMRFTVCSKHVYKDLQANLERYFYKSYLRMFQVNKLCFSLYSSLWSTISASAPLFKFITSIYHSCCLRHLCCYNKITQTGELTNNRNVVFTVLEGKNSRIRNQHVRILVRVLLLVHGQCLLSVCSLGQSGQGVPCGLFYKNMDPIHEAFILIT